MPEQLQPDELQEIVDPANPIGNYRIKLDGQWLFEEFSELPHIYLQAYGFFAEIESIVGIENLLREPEGAVRHPLDIELINPSICEGSTIRGRGAGVRRIFTQVSLETCGSMPSRSWYKFSSLLRGSLS
jgi:hypothetical protein